MKIFGLEINKLSKQKFDTVIVRPAPLSTKVASQIPPVSIPTLSYAQQFSGKRGVFISPEYDLSEIGKIEDVEGYVRQVFKKKEGLMFKEGLALAGANKDTVRYLKSRMSQIACATEIPTHLLLKRTARSLIRTSNAYLIKVRKQSASGGKIRILHNGKVLEPVAGYFPAAPESMRADLDADTGRIVKWRQILPNGRYRDHQPENVVHFTIDRREGFVFGIPTVVPVIDDIRALRQIEENIELLLYQHLFPLFHYKVGTELAPAGYTEKGELEIDVVRQQIRLMPAEGAIVTPERHEIKAVGAEGRAVRAEGYLTHFKQRVFAGLGVSEVDMGEGSTANRSTANVLSRALIDSVKSIQDDLEAQWDTFIISELLLESTFGLDVLEEHNMVHLQFAEIDIQNKIEQEKHAAELFKNYGLTFDEYRTRLSMEPISIPEDPNDQDPSKYPEWHQTYWKLIEEPINLIRAVDEPYSPAAQAAVSARSTALTQVASQQAQLTKEREASILAKEERKTKIAVTKAKPIKKKDSFLRSAYGDLESLTINRIQSSFQSRNRFDEEYIRTYVLAWANKTAAQMQSFAIGQFIKGFKDQGIEQQNNIDILLSIARQSINSRIDFYINRLATDLIKLIKYRVDGKFDNVTLANIQSNINEEIHIAFDTLKYRIDLIWDAETRKAYFFGKALALKLIGCSSIEYEAHADACEACKLKDKRRVFLAALDLEDIPPLHPYSRMGFRGVFSNQEDN